MRVSGRQLGWMLIGIAWALPAALLIACLFFFAGKNFSELARIHAGMKEAEVVALVGPGKWTVSKCRTPPSCVRAMRFKERYRHAALEAVARRLNGRWNSGAFIRVCVDAGGTVQTTALELLHF
jgi:hypothetical protein